MSMPVIRLRQSAQFPANVYGNNGIDVTKQNGNYTIEMDWSAFTPGSIVPTSPTNYVLSFDAVTQVYALIPTSLLGGGGGGSGVSDAPSDGFSYGRLNAAWAKVAPLDSPALTGTPTTPTAAIGTNTTQIATTAFVLANGSSIPPATVAPIMDGAAAVGVATKYAREDHVHPSDTSRAAVSHSHTASNITDFSEAVDDRVGALLVAGSNITLAYNDAANSLTINSTASGSGGGDVTGPSSAGADRIATFNGTTGKIIKDSGTLLSGLQPTITPAALTKSDDTNVTMTLGGTPSTALLQATSMTLGWTGTLSAARGGFGMSVASSSGVPLFATGVPTFTATTGTGNFIRANAPSFTGTVISAGPVAITNTTASTNYLTGALTVGGGLGVTGQLNVGSSNSKFIFDGDSANGLFIQSVTAGTSGVLMAFSDYTGATAGTISYTGAQSGVAYNVSSDVRLKENLQSFDAGRIVDDTDVYSFTWKSSGERSYGVMAQQANEVYPEAVTFWKEKDWWGIDYSKYVPILLQEVKALRARVADLEGRIATKPGALQ